MNQQATSLNGRMKDRKKGEVSNQLALTSNGSNFQKMGQEVTDCPKILGCHHYYINNKTNRKLR
jgi:hypothetical protein